MSEEDAAAASPRHPLRLKGDVSWHIRAEVDLAASGEEGTVIVRVTEVLRL